jgi:glycosyltransferase involved in cell wall biosynthesis
MNKPLRRPRVSILLATYRAGRFLSRQLASIEKQSIWGQAELVVVANEPSRGEQAQLEAFRQRHPSQVRFTVVPRESLYASWNRAVRMARGNTLAIANVDDIRTSNGLELQVAALEGTAEALFAYGSFIIVKRVGEMTGRLVEAAPFDGAEFTRGMFLGPFFVWTPKVAGGPIYFDEQFRSGGDFDFAIRLARLGWGIRVDAVLGYYYDGGSGLSTGSHLQPIERTVIELRYGIYDKVDYDYLPEALRYDRARLFWGGQGHPVATCVPGYADWMVARHRQWFAAGIRQYWADRHKKRCQRSFLEGVRVLRNSWNQAASALRGGE